MYENVGYDICDIYMIYAKVVSGYWRQLSAEDEPKWEVTDESR